MPRLSHESPGGQVARVAVGADAMQIEFEEEVIQHGGDGLPGIALALMAAGNGEAQHRLAAEAWP